MATNIFVGSLPFSITEQELKQLFAKQGQVNSVKIINDRYTGNSRGFGFVEMNTEEETKKAIENLNGYDLEGRNIVVKEALPKPNYTSGRGSNFGRRNRSRNRKY